MMTPIKRFLSSFPPVVIYATALLALAFLLLLLFGCSPLTTQTRTEAVKQQQASTGASSAAVDVVSKVIEQPKQAPSVGTLTVSGENNKVEIVPPPAPDCGTPDTRETSAHANTNQKGGTSDQYSHVGEDSSHLTIIGWAVGLGLLAMVVFGIIWTIRRYSFAADAAWNTLDKSLADKIQRARTRAATSSDPMEMAKANAEAAELERERRIVSAE